jgi:hypothetical protein
MWLSLKINEKAKSSSSKAMFASREIKEREEGLFNVWVSSVYANREMMEKRKLWLLASQLKAIYVLSHCSKSAENEILRQAGHGEGRKKTGRLYVREIAVILSQQLAWLMAGNLWRLMA